jgi:soluble lytic murein transglycosylase-like protein
MTTDEIIQLVQQYAGWCGIDPGMAVEQARIESANFAQDVIFGPTESPAHARGLMQFTKGAWDQYGAGDFSNAFDIYANLDAWCQYMQDLMAMFGGDANKALMAYVGGPAHVTGDSPIPPSQTAVNYAARIVAKASGPAPGAGNQPQDSGLSPWLIAGAIGLFLVVFMSRK